MPVRILSKQSKRTQGGGVADPSTGRVPQQRRHRASRTEATQGVEVRSDITAARGVVTIFEDVAAATKTEIVVNAVELFEYVKAVTEYPTKASCPLLKLAKFGGLKSVKGSIRFDDNVVEVYGAEGDYDGGVLPMEDAAALVRDAGVVAIFYSSPSYTPSKPRWRVLAPTSEPLPPERRRDLVGRLNGILGGVLAVESFALSQSYYVGRVSGVAYDALLVRGTRFIDQVDVDELYPHNGDKKAVVGVPLGVEDHTLRATIRDGSAGVHNALVALAARLVGRGMATTDVEASLDGLMREVEWRNSDVQRWTDRRTAIPSVVASAVRKFAGKLKLVHPPEEGGPPPSAFLGPSEEYTTVVDRTDTGNLNLMVKLTGGNLRYVVETREWMIWRGGQWHMDAHGGFVRDAALLVAQHYMRTAAHYDQEAKKATDDKERKGLHNAAVSARAWEKQCRDRKRIDALCILATKESRLQISATDLDRNHRLLGVQNGVVDLSTGLLREAAREDFVTKLCAVDFVPDAKAPTWERAIVEITGKPLPVVRFKSGEVNPASVGKFNPRPDLALYLQRALGYSLTGLTAEHKLFVCYGPGANGKNVILDVLQGLLTGNCVTIPPDALMATRHDADAERPTSIAASLAGARMAVSSESKDGQKLDAGVVKRHTGGGYMAARRLRENIFRFEITHKLWLMTNHLPRLDHLDPALRGRLHIIPFDRRWNRPGEVARDSALPDGDKNLPEKLSAELKGILAWLVRGAVEYLKSDLTPPTAVLATTKSYFEEQNPLPRWIATLDRVHSPTGGTKASELLAAFRDWCSANEERSEGVTQKQVSAALSDAGIASKPTNKGVFYAVRVPTDMILGSLM